MMPLLSMFLLATAPHLAQNNSQTQGDDYLGAAGLMASLAKPREASAVDDPRLLFIAHVNDFDRRKSSLTSNEAAHQWLSLFREGTSLKSYPMEPERGYRTEYLNVLPPPSAWPRIEALVDHGWETGTYRPKLVKLLMEVLEGRYRNALGLARSMAKTEGNSHWKDYLPDLEMELAMRLRDADAIERVLVERSPNAMVSGTFFNVPDIVPVVGTERASRILLKLLSTKRGEFTFGDGEHFFLAPSETQKLALGIVLNHENQLAYPQWTLAYSPDAGNLFERMMTRFPGINTTRVTGGLGAPNWIPYEGAATACLVNLWRDGHVARARSFALKYATTLGFGFTVNSGRQTLISRLAETGNLDAFINFLGELVVSHPDSGLTYFMQSCALAAPAPLIEEVTGKCLKRVPSDQRLGLGAMYLDALLAQGKYSAAASLVSRNVDLPDNAFFHRNDAPILRRLADVLHRPDLLLLAKERAAQYPSPFIDKIDEPDLNGPEMERSLIVEIRTEMANRSGNDPRVARYYAAKLARLYHRVGRDRDVVALFNDFPGWGVPDLRYVDNDRELLPRVAPMVLAKMGRHDDAVRLLQFAIEQQPNDDRPYELMLQLAPDEAGPTFEQFAYEFPLNHRPLLWRAEWLRLKHRLPDAKALCERAMASDPMDLNSHVARSAFRGERVLVAIARDMGDPTAADSLRKYSRAAELLGEAENLSELRFDLIAESDYRQALELVPTYCPARYALGEMEIRDGEMDKGARDIDLAVNALPSKTGALTYLPFPTPMAPFHAQFAYRDSLHTLIARGTANATGYLAASQVDSELGAWELSIREAQKAVELDPDCLGGWSALADADNLVPEHLQKRALTNSIRLRRGDSWGDRILDCAAVWDAFAALPTAMFGPEDSILPLPASRKVLTQHVDTVSDFIEVTERDRDRRFAHDSLISMIGELISSEGTRP